MIRIVSPSQIRKSAFFFDLDGTLVNIAPSPAQIVVSSKIIYLLSQLQNLTNGALAIISGRSIASVDYVLSPLRLAIAGSHGAEWRESEGVINRVNYGREELDLMYAEIEKKVSPHKGFLIERKDLGIALHYRLAPTLQELAYNIVQEAIKPNGNIFSLQKGKMVIEIVPSIANKGKAIKEFMRKHPFFGRKAIFVGDDLTDEKGFIEVNHQGGISIKVGTCNNTHALYSLSCVEECVDWIEQLVSLSD